MKKMASNVANLVVNAYRVTITSPRPMESALEFQSQVRSISQTICSLSASNCSHTDESMNEIAANIATPGRQ